MKRNIMILVVFILALIHVAAFAQSKRYGERFCLESGYVCYTVKAGDTWEKLFPNPDDCDVVKRLNRLNLNLRAGWIIAIPKNLGKITHFDISPFALNISNPSGEKEIIVDLNILAWGAYDAEGNLIHWGPASGGRGWCEDIGRPCHTQTGNYMLYQKLGPDCISNKFPIPYGGAAMPYCMHYFGPYALHGSFEVPGYNDSHGCVRLFIEDARWLNNEFADYHTKIIVKPY
jgi:hypothetical protein